MDVDAPDKVNSKCTPARENSQQRARAGSAEKKKVELVWTQAEKK